MPVGVDLPSRGVATARADHTAEYHAYIDTAITVPARARTQTNVNVISIVTLTATATPSFLPGLKSHCLVALTACASNPYCVSSERVTVTSRTAECRASFSSYDTSMHVEFTAVFRQVPEGYVGFVEELPGANTQGSTLEEARHNLQEAIELVIEANRELIGEATRGQSVIREAIKVRV